MKREMILSATTIPALPGYRVISQDRDGNLTVDPSDIVGWSVVTYEFHPFEEQGPFTRVKPLRAISIHHGEHVAILQPDGVIAGEHGRTYFSIDELRAALLEYKRIEEDCKKFAAEFKAKMAGTQHTEKQDIE
jgi:hypothetical protein